MGNRQTLPLLLVAALLAGGAFFWLDSGGRRSETPRVEPAPAAASQAAGEAAADLESARVPTPPAGTGEEARRVVIEAPPETAAAGTPRSAGRVRVTGTVTDAAGHPLAGARVRGTDNGGLGGFEVLGDPDLVKAIETETDDEGRFVLDGVKPGLLYLLVRRSGFAPYRRDKIGIPREAELLLEPCVLEAGAILGGVVVDPTGRGVPGAEIFSQEGGPGGFVLLGSRTPLTVTDETGAFRIDQLAIGPWRFLVHSEEHPDRMFSGATERNALEVTGLRWALEPGARIAGQVTGIPLEEREGLEVRGTRAGRTLAVDDLEAFVGASRVAAVDSSGRFELHGVDVGGTYELQARRKRKPGAFDFWERSRSDSVVAQAGDRGVVLSYQPEAAVVLTVVDASSGAPVENLQVSAGIEWPVAVRGEDGRPRRFFPEGRVRAGGLRPSGPDERVSLSIEATGYREYRREDIALRAGQELDLGILRLDPVPVLRVQVLDAMDQQPVVGARVHVSRDEGDRTSVRRAIEFGADGLNDTVEFGDGRSGVTDDKGWAEITSLEGQTVLLTARARGYAPLQRSGLFLPPGQRVEQQVLLSRGGEAFVQVVDARGLPMVGARVAHREPNAPAVHFGAGSDHVTDSNGGVVFENLQAGLHSFRIDDGQSAGAFFSNGDTEMIIGGMGGDEGDDWSELQVSEGERAELRLVAAPRGLLAGRVREGGEPLAGATISLRDPEQEESHAFPFGGGQGPKGASDGNGRYRITDVKAGRYTLSVEHPGRQMAEEYPLEIREGDNAFDVDLPLSILEGRVTDEGGAPLAGVRVWPVRKVDEGPRRQGFAMIVMDDGGGGSGSVIQSDGGSAKPVRTDADGRYALRGVASGVDLIVKAEGDTVQPGQSDPVQVARDEVRRNVDVALEAGGAIDVSAEAADGSPARMCFVQASFAGEEAGGVQPKFSFIQSGSTTLKGLRPGPWKLTVRRAGPGNNDDPGEEQVIEVEVGETAEASFRLD